MATEKRCVKLARFSTIAQTVWMQPIVPSRETRVIIQQLDSAELRSEQRLSKEEKSGESSKETLLFAHEPRLDECDATHSALSDIREQETSRKK